MDIKVLTGLVRQTAYEIHVYFGHGHLEKVYENALAHRLRKSGLHVVQQCPLQVRDEDDVIVGDYFADLFVESRLIVELKATRTIAPEHEAQILGYLRASRMGHGLLVSFGSFRFQVRKYAWDPKVQRERSVVGS
jgi:GxxExxY protein